MNHPRIGLYGHVNGSGFPYIENGILVQSRIDAAAKYDDVILDCGSVEAFPQIKNALRAANPALRLHAYQVMAAWNNPHGPQMFIDIWNMVQSTGGYIASPPPGYCNINPAIAPTMYGMVEIIKRYATGWDSVFADVLIPRPGTANGFDWRSMGFQTDQAFLDAWGANAAEFMTRLAPATSNYGIGFPGIAQGNMYEEFHRDWPRWISSQQEGELHLGFPSAWICSAHSGYDPQSPENQRVNRFGLGTALLFGGFHSFGRYEGDKLWTAERLEPGWWMKEYQHPQLGKGWLGQPTEPPPLAPSRSNRFIWMREFARGIAIVNTDQNQPHSVYLPHRYRPIGGAAKDGWSIPARDALIAEAM